MTKMEAIYFILAWFIPIPLLWLVIKKEAKLFGIKTGELFSYLVGPCSILPGVNLAFLILIFMCHIKHIKDIKG